MWIFAAVFKAAGFWCGGLLPFLALSGVLVFGFLSAFTFRVRVLSLHRRLARSAFFTRGLAFFLQLLKLSDVSFPRKGR